jgi:hypothetical protein
MKSATWLGWRFTMAIVVFILALVTPAGAQDTILGRATLAGLTGVHVHVERMNPDAEKEGLSHSTLQTDVELRLRQAGIRVLSEEEAVAAPGLPWLYLQVTTLRKERGLYAYFIKVWVRQLVRLFRDPDIGSVATTWETPGVIGVIGSKNLSTVREDVRDEIDQFINAYLAANPKR